MDLRIVKTKKIIKEAFLQLRAKTPLEKIKVRDICNLALISKSTFYNHYEDVFALSEEMENEVLSDSFYDFKYKDCLFTNPKLFLENVATHLEKNNTIIEKLFKGRYEVLYLKLEKQLRDYYKKPNLTADEDILLTFIIGGAMRTGQIFSCEKKYDNKILAKNMAQFIEKLKK